MEIFETMPCLTEFDRIMNLSLDELYEEFGDIL